MADRTNFDVVKREKQKAERAELEKAKQRIRVMNYVLGRAGYKIESMIIDGFPGPMEFESLDYDVGALRILWRKHLAWLKTMGLRGVGPKDVASIRDCFDEGDDGNFPAEVIEG